jgi:hypothetical protein
MFPSQIIKLTDKIPLPDFKDLRILLMPIILGDNESIPDKDLIPMMEAISKTYIAEPHKDKVVYLTIDQKIVKPKETHRRKGLHVDGYPHTITDANLRAYPGIWAGVSHGGTWGGGGGPGGGAKNFYWWDGTGLLTISDVEGCRAWNKSFHFEPKPEGDCEHLREQCTDNDAIILEPNVLYWMSPGCVHESMPMNKETKRTFVRISLPSKCDWYEGCTPNPLGIKPTGKVNYRRRKFMDEV